MTVEDKDRIDIVQISEAKRNANLIVSDHLDWESVDHHLYALQEKINTYIAYIESGQVYEDYPESRDYSMTIQVYGKYDRPDDAINFYNRVREILKNVDCGFEFILKA